MTDLPNTQEIAKIKPFSDDEFYLSRKEIEETLLANPHRVRIFDDIVVTTYVAAIRGPLRYGIQAFDRSTDSYSDFHWHSCPTTPVEATVSGRQFVAFPPSYAPCTPVFQAVELARGVEASLGEAPPGRRKMTEGLASDRIEDPFLQKVCRAGDEIWPDRTLRDRFRGSVPDDMTMDELRLRARLDINRYRHYTWIAESAKEERDMYHANIEKLRGLGVEIDAQREKLYHKMVIFRAEIFGDFRVSLHCDDRRSPTTIGVKIEHRHALRGTDLCFSPGSCPRALYCSFNEDVGFGLPTQAQGPVPEAWENLKIDFEIDESCPGKMEISLVLRQPDEAPVEQEDVIEADETAPWAERSLFIHSSVVRFETRVDVLVDDFDKPTTIGMRVVNEKSGHGRNMIYVEQGKYPALLQFLYDKKHGFAVVATQYEPIEPDWRDYVAIIEHGTPSFLPQKEEGDENLVTVTFDRKPTAQG